MDRTAFIPGLHPHEGAALPFYSREVMLMNKAAPLAALPDKGPQAQVLFVDGHKVTVRYSGDKNPPALQAIKDVLINSVSTQKD